MVRDDGVYLQPTLGEVVAAGKETTALVAELKIRLRQIVVDPDISVAIVRAAPVRVSVVGEVKTPGLYELKTDRGVVTALAASGWLTDFAHRDRVFVIRQAGSGTTWAPQVAQRIRFRTEDLNEPGVKRGPLPAPRRGRRGGGIEPDWGRMFWPGLVALLAGSFDLNAGVATEVRAGESPVTANQDTQPFAAALATPMVEVQLKDHPDGPAPRLFPQARLAVTQPAGPHGSAAVPQPGQSLPDRSTNDADDRLGARRRVVETDYSVIALLLGAGQGTPSRAGRVPQVARSRPSPGEPVSQAT